MFTIKNQESILKLLICFFLSKVNSLKSFLLTAPRIDNLDLVDSYLPADNGTRSKIFFFTKLNLDFLNNKRKTKNLLSQVLLKSLNNSCDLYDYFSICQNGGACNLNANSAPTCM